MQHFGCTQYNGIWYPIVSVHMKQNNKSYILENHGYDYSHYQRNDSVYSSAY